MDLDEYTIKGSQDTARILLRNNIRWITLRWYYMLLLAVISIALSLLSSLSLDRVFEYTTVLVAGYLINGALLFFARRSETKLTTQRTVMVAQLFLDLVMCGVVIYIQGGIEARTTTLFAIPIVASGLAFTRRMVIPVAAISGLVYVVTILLHGVIEQGAIDFSEYAMPVVFYPLLFLVIARVVEFLMTLESHDMRERTYNSFLSLLAHQLKHPASASKTIIDVIQHDETAHHTEQTKHYLQLLRGESENQVRLIDNLLEAAPRHTSDLHLSKVDISLLLERVAHQTARGHQRTSDLVRDRSAGGAVFVQGSPIRLQLALTNIFDNSFRHTADGVSVHYGATLDAGMVEIVISDEGSGMDAVRLSRVKERFSVGNVHDAGARHVGGLGLGLYVAQRIVAAHEGTLTLQSKEGRGTTITIRMKGARE